MKYIVFILSIIFSASVYSQQVKVPEYFTIDNSLSDSLHSILKEVGLDSTFNVGEDGTEQISLAVIDLNGKVPVLGGVNYDNFIYPASVYKMYVAMEVLSEISNGDYYLSTPYVVKSPNDVDKVKEISYDPRPLLTNGDTVTINYLLDLMITRSDNSAANCLIDVATRDSINKMIHHFNWYGSEVTRKFLSRKYEDPRYKKIRGTETCALHAADYMYRVYTNKLVNPWVSMQMKALLCRQLDTTKLSKGLTHNTMFYHKTGWWSYWTNDVGIVQNGNFKYIIACFTPVEEKYARPRMKELSKRVYALLKQRHFRR